jgi:hypothetical protein
MPSLTGVEQPVDQAHAARADRLAELGLVTEDRDLDVAVLGRVDEHRVRRCLNLAPVDRERDHLDVGARHGYAATSDAATASRRASM